MTDRLGHLIPVRTCIHGVPLGGAHLCFACSARAVGYVNPVGVAIVALRRIADICVKAGESPELDKILSIALKASNVIEEQQK